MGASGVESKEEHVLSNAIIMKERMNDIKTKVWSGFFGEELLDEMIDGLDLDEVNMCFLRSFAGEEFRRKEEEEENWTSLTDCDRLRTAFTALKEEGILAVHKPGGTLTSSRRQISTILERMDDKKQFKGYCFYHEQDVEAAVDLGELMIAFGDMEDDSDGSMLIGKKIKQVLEGHDFVVHWNGDCDTRLRIDPINWKWRNYTEMQGPRKGAAMAFAVNRVSINERLEPGSYEWFQFG